MDTNYTIAMDPRSLKYADYRRLLSFDKLADASDASSAAGLIALLVNVELQATKNTDAPYGALADVPANRAPIQGEDDVLWDDYAQAALLTLGYGIYHGDSDVIIWNRETSLFYSELWRESADSTTKGTPCQTTVIDVALHQKALGKLDKRLYKALSDEDKAVIDDAEEAE